MSESRPGAVVLAGYGDIAARIARQINGARPVRAINRSGRQARIHHPPKLVQTPLCAAGRTLCEGDTLIWLAPPPRDGLVESSLEFALRDAPDLAKIVYLSTSGVYGDCHGDWVDESQPVSPSSDRARRRVSGEQLTQQYATNRGIPWAIARVPGIYGPGRLPRARLEKQLPVLAESLSPWSNRIHAEDLAAVFVRLIDEGEGIFNVGDGRPGTITEYFHAVADVLGMSHLPEVSKVDILTPELASYMRESRRLQTRRLRDDLGFTPAWPDFRKALPHCIYDDLVWEGTPEKP